MPRGRAEWWGPTRELNSRGNPLWRGRLICGASPAEGRRRIAQGEMGDRRASTTVTATKGCREALARLLALPSAPQLAKRRRSSSPTGDGARVYVESTIKSRQCLVIARGMRFKKQSLRMSATMVLVYDSDASPDGTRRPRHTVPHRSGFRRHVQWCKSFSASSSSSRTISPAG